LFAKQLLLTNTVNN